MSEVDLLSPPDAAAVERAIQSFAVATRNRYGARLKGVYLFGSRARGDFKPFSDADIALVLAGQIKRSIEDIKSLSDLAYDLLLETGVEVQPWPFNETDWRNPEGSSEPGLIKAIKRDAKQVWGAM